MTQSPVGARLAREKGTAIIQANRVIFFAGKPRSYSHSVGHQDQRTADDRGVFAVQIAQRHRMYLFS